MLQVFPVVHVAPGDGLDILGGAPVGTVDVPLAIEIGKTDESRAKAALIVKNVIEMMRLMDKERKSADYLLSQLQKANQLIQNAVTAGLRSESRKEGVDKHIAAIEQGIARIKLWLAQNA